MESFKYGFGSAPARRFDEERFLFPRNYERNRVRLVVRDPEWLFAYWDVNPRAFESIRLELGERVMALSRLTLKIVDSESSASEVILLPYGARSWYVRLNRARRSVLAELGITLPSGLFRSLGRSNTVRLPHAGPSAEPASRTVRYDEAWNRPESLVEDSETWLPREAEPGSGLLAQTGASDRFVREALERAQPEVDSVGAGLGGSDAFRRR